MGQQSKHLCLNQTMTAITFKCRFVLMLRELFIFAFRTLRKQRVALSFIHLHGVI